MDWLPLVTAWRDDQMRRLVESHNGLRRLGFRVECVGVGGLGAVDVQVLVVEVPKGDRLESGEMHILRALHPLLSEDWAMGLHAAMRSRWREYVLWRGTSSEFSVVRSRCKLLNDSIDSEFEPPLWGAFGSDPVSLFAYRWSAVRIALALAGDANQVPLSAADSWWPVDVISEAPGDLTVSRLVGVLSECGLSVLTVARPTLGVDLVAVRVGGCVASLEPRIEGAIGRCGKPAEWMPWSFEAGAVVAGCERRHLGAFRALVGPSLAGVPHRINVGADVCLLEVPTHQAAEVAYGLRSRLRGDAD